MNPTEPGVIHEGDRIGASYLRTIAERANLVTRMVGTNGVSVKIEQGRIVISGEKGFRLPVEPANLVTVINLGTTDLDIYAVAGIDENYYTTRPKCLDTRIIEVQEPEPYHAGQFVVTLEPILQDHVGLAWFSGICLARLVREFDGPLLHRADCVDGSQALRASVNGPVRILWEETTDPEGDPLDPEEEHFAVVQWDGRGDTYMDWFNAGGAAVGNGCPVVSSEAGTGDGISANDRLSLKPPVNDADPMAMVNVGGSVAAGENGKVYTGVGPYMARVNSAVNAMRTVGTRSTTTDKFVVDSVFWRVLAYLGTNVAGEHWAILQRDTAPALLIATDDPAADTIKCKAADEDGGVGSEEMTLPTAFNP